jgi:hypothetical protein
LAGKTLKGREPAPETAQVKILKTPESAIAMDLETPAVFPVQVEEVQRPS